MCFSHKNFFSVLFTEFEEGDRSSDYYFIHFLLLHGDSCFLSPGRQGSGNICDQPAVCLPVRLTVDESLSAQ